MKNLLAALFIVCFIFQSCENKTDKKARERQQTTKVSEKEIKIDTKVDQHDTLNIKYAEHKNLLDILTKLPAHSMSSWKWTEEERVDFVKCIQENNFALSPTPQFSKIALIGPNALGIQVVDGYWTMAIYRIKPGNYIVITDDQVGGGNDISAFEYENGSLREMDYQSLFNDGFLGSLLKNDEDTCEDLLEDNLIGFEYDFTRISTIKISNDYYLKQNEHNNCLKGNTVLFRFNPIAKKFDLEKITWEKNSE